MTVTRLDVAYQAAYDALSGRYNGNIPRTAHQVARLLCYRTAQLPALVRSFNARRPLVDQLVILAAAGKVRGGVDHCRPLLDSAVALAAQALATNTATRG